MGQAENAVSEGVNDIKINEKIFNKIDDIVESKNELIIQISNSAADMANCSSKVDEITSFGE